MQTKTLLGLSAALVAGLGTALVVPASGAGTDHPLTVADFSFTPGTVSIAVGDSVTWSYPSGASKHNIDFTDGPVFQQPSMPTAPGWTATRTFLTAGTFRYVCDLHATMHGTVIV